MNNRPRRLWRYWIAGGVLAWSWGMPLSEHSFTLPTAYAHHGGGGSGGSGGSGGGKGDGMARKTPSDGYGKGGRGFQGMKP